MLTYALVDSEIVGEMTLVRSQRLLIGEPPNWARDDLQSSMKATLVGPVVIWRSQGSDLTI